MGDVFEDVQVVTNSGPSPLSVWFEPWGMPHQLLPGESFRVEGRSQEAGRLEIVQTDGSAAVYGWAGATLRVYQGDVLVDDFSSVVPELPPGMSPRSFVASMFGGPGAAGQVAEPNVATDDEGR